MHCIESQIYRICHSSSQRWMTVWVHHARTMGSARIVLLDMSVSVLRVLLEYTAMKQVITYRRPGFNCVVKQLHFWLFKVDCEFKDCDLRMLCIGHTCVIYTLHSNTCKLREKSQFAIIKLRKWNPAYGIYTLYVVTPSKHVIMGVEYWFHCNN